MRRTGFPGPDRDDRRDDEVPGVSRAQLDQLFEGARTAASTGLGQTMLVMAAILVAGAVAVWFGMRERPATPQPASGSAVSD